MTTITALLAAVVLSTFQDPPAPAPAQDGDGEGGRRPGRVQFGGGGWGGGVMDAERANEMRIRSMKEQLGLTDEQVAKVTEIFKQSREAEQKVEADRTAKVRETLTDDQKKKYDEMIANQARAQGPLGFLDRMATNWSDRLKKELSLDDATYEKVKAHIDEFRKKIAERGEKLRADGGQLNWQEEMQKFQEGSKELGEKIKGHLSPEQKEKYDKMVEQMQGPGRFGGGGDGGRRTPPSAEERATRAVEALKITDADELKAVKAAVQKVFEAQGAMGELEREYWTKVEELRKDTGMTDEQVTGKLNELRTARLEKDKAVKAAQAALREIVSVRQELELFRHGALR
jgi:Spy/CpxP family protein refolding chaperone